MLKLAAPSAEPGGEIPVTGTGCNPGGDITAYFGSQVLGTVRAQKDGSFALRILLPEVEVGRYNLELQCGPTLIAPVDVVIASSKSGGISTLALFIFFVLVITAVFRRRRYPGMIGSHPPLEPGALPNVPS